MRKYIEIDEEVLKSIMEGKFVQGSLHYNKQAKCIDFNHYKRKKRLKDKVIAILEHGWLKESPKRVKYYISLKKSIGTARMIAAMERENRVASSHLMDREIVDRV